MENCTSAGSFALGLFIGAFSFKKISSNDAKGFKNQSKLYVPVLIMAAVLLNSLNLPTVKIF
jgi:hypothetical protein